jgi:hypothetical protein
MCMIIVTSNFKIERKTMYVILYFTNYIYYKQFFPFKSYIVIIILGIQKMAKKWNFYVFYMFFPT